MRPIDKIRSEDSAPPAQEGGPERVVTQVSSCRPLIVAGAADRVPSPDAPGVVRLRPLRGPALVRNNVLMPGAGYVAKLAQAGDCCCASLRTDQRVLEYYQSRQERRPQRYLREHLVVVALHVDLHVSHRSSYVPRDELPHRQQRHLLLRNELVVSSGRAAGDGFVDHAAVERAKL
eukprot:scaffold10947_cov99-Phaeocystis_antarctica.AAC.2